MTTEIDNPVFQVWNLNDEDLDQIFERPKKGIYMAPARPWAGWFHKALLYSSAVQFCRGKQVVLIATAPEYVGILENQKNLGFLVRTNHEKGNNGD
jgi:hypothetical protein